MQMLSTAFAERKEINMEELDDEAAREFLQLYEKRVFKDLKTTLIPIMGSQRGRPGGGACGLAGA